MKYFGLTINLKNDPQIIEKYKTCHQNVWPGVEHGLRQAGVTQMKIFLLGTRLFMYMEAEDNYDALQARKVYMEQPGVSNWDALMQELQEPVAEAAPGEWWALMEPVYELKE